MLYALPNPKNNDVIYKRRVTDQINPFLIENAPTLTPRHVPDNTGDWDKKKNTFGKTLKSLFHADG